MGETVPLRSLELFKPFRNSCIDTIYARVLTDEQCLERYGHTVPSLPLRSYRLVKDQWIYSGLAVYGRDQSTTPIEIDLHIEPLSQLELESLDIFLR